MQLIGTIKHNDNRRADRVNLYAGDDGYVYTQATDESEPVKADTSVDRVGSAWGDEAWDLELAQ